MLILGMDTSTDACGVAIADGETLLVEYVERGVVHSARLLPLVEAALAAAGRDRRELAGVAVTVGPGSYTGLRIGLATAKALGFALGVSTVGVTSLEALAHAGGVRDGLVCPMLDARRERVYTALYGWDGPDLAVREAPRVTEAEAWLDRLSGARVFFTGDGALRYRGLIRRLVGEGAVLAEPYLAVARPAAVAVLGYRRLARGAGGSPGNLSPMYLAERRDAAPEV